MTDPTQHTEDVDGSNWPGDAEGFFFRLKPSTTLLAVLFATFLAPTAWGDEQRLSINGYDPVAYFTDGKPVQGKSEFEYSWHRLRWRFASGEHRDLFTRDPKRYSPQYDGYCAMGAADEPAHKDTVDPEAWAIVDVARSPGSSLRHV